MFSRALMLLSEERTLARTAFRLRDMGLLPLLVGVGAAAAGVSFFSCSQRVVSYIFLSIIATRRRRQKYPRICRTAPSERLFAHALVHLRQSAEYASRGRLLVPSTRGSGPATRYFLIVASPPLRFCRRYMASTTPLRSTTIHGKRRAGDNSTEKGPPTSAQQTARQCRPDVGKI